MQHWLSYEDLRTVGIRYGKLAQRVISVVLAIYAKPRASEQLANIIARFEPSTECT